MPPKLVLHLHPFASYCQKVLIALYELDVPFAPHVVDGVEGRAELARLWPPASIPVLRDETAGRTLPESTTIIEHVDAIAGPKLVPTDPDDALQARLWDRFYDHHVATPMQKIVTDRIRPEGRNDPEGVDEAHRRLDVACGVADGRLAQSQWAAGDTFTVADCAAAPALFYCRAIHRWDESGQAHITRYYRALMARRSIARVVEEARPYRGLFPHPWPDDMDDLG
jgi:glutathione S-transferase